MIVNGWQLFAHPLFLHQSDRLTAGVERERARDPSGYTRSANAKLLAALGTLIFQTIPADPTRADYCQGGTLGAAQKHWFRAKFGGQRFRLFFRFDAGSRIIILTWVNDSTTLRTYGAKTDAYAVFRKMLAAGNPPDDWPELLAAASKSGAIELLDQAAGD